MIAAILVAHLYRPFVLTWSVDWGGKLNPTTHSRTFETAEEAFNAREHAPMCGEKEPQPIERRSPHA